jgi:hypothetical protein
MKNIWLEHLRGCYQKELQANLYYQPIGRSDPGKPRRRWLSSLRLNELKSSILADDVDSDDNYSVGFQLPS